MSLLALQDLFRRRREKATGIWKLGGETGRTIYMNAGDIVFAQSGVPEDRLTAILVARGKLTQAQMDYALANLKPGLSIGKNLIEMGFITQRDLLDTARVQVERVVWGAMGTPGETPAFEQKGLDATVVRLPLDTPAMLLAGLLGLEDRERVLDLLGPVNQVVVLADKRVHELPLPQDLSKMLALFDGKRTMLDLSRESGIEPFRLGAFCLFLREMGWGRLHESPPSDQGTLEQAAFPSQPSGPPRAEPAPRPTLIAAIEAAGRATTNLEHMSAALDELPEPHSAPTPALPLAPLPGETEELALQISEASSISLTSSRNLAGSRKRIRTSLLIFLILLALFASAWWLKPWRSFLSTPPPSPAKAPSAPKAAMDPPPAQAPSPGDLPPLAPPQNALPSEKSAAPLDSGMLERLTAIRTGAWELALRQGKAHQASLLNPPRWTLRLEVACVGSTVQNAIRLVEQQDPDLWLFPIRMRDGKTCYQVLLGDYPSEAAAENAIKGLPRTFNAPGSRPRIFRVTDLPDMQ